jgi:hypothetical protein
MPKHGGLRFGPYSPKSTPIKHVGPRRPAKPERTAVKLSSLGGYRATPKPAPKRYGP